MMHKAWYSTEEVSYCFSRSSITFEGHMDRKIDDLNPITLTPYAVLQLFATRFAACTGGIWVTFIEPYLI